MWSRRAFLLVASGGIATALSSRRSRSEATTTFQHPPRKGLQAGDFLWTSRRDAFIPYGSGDTMAEQQARSWATTRDELTRQLLASPHAAERQGAVALRAMSLEDFRTIYFEGRRPTDPVPYSGSPSVGHVAIVDVQNGTLMIIEARPTSQSSIDVAFSSFKNGVVARPYDEWLKDHDDHLIWQGRLRKYADPSDRARVATKAREYVGRDYNFRNFDLTDTSGFYCSKLVWLATFQSLGIPLDGDSSTRRSLWVSPKQLINRNQEIRMINVPGVYGGD